MAAFGHVNAQQQYVSSFQFASDNPHPDSFEGVIPPTNPAPQQSNNHKAFTTGQKRKATPDNQQPNYIPYKQPAQQFFCEICNVQLNSLSQASQHKQGKVHKLNAMMFDSLNSTKDLPEVSKSSCGLDQSSPAIITPKGQTKQNVGINLECIICQKRFNSRTQAEQHFNGQTHKRKLQTTLLGSKKMDPALPQNIALPSTTQPNESTQVQELPEGTPLVTATASQVALSSENLETNELYCEFCGLAVNSKIQMDTHLKGAKHKNAVARAALSKENNDMKNTPAMVFYCDDCHTNFNSQSQLLQHLASPKHKNRANRVQREQTAGQFRGVTRGRGRGHGRGRGALRGAQGHRGRGGAAPVLPISASFVKPTSNFTNMGNYGYPFNPPGQATNYTQTFTNINPTFQPSFV